MKFKSYRDESRANYGRMIADSESMQQEDIKLGALLRIADACELMSKNHAQLIDERDRYKSWYEGQRARNFRLERSISSLRGVITRMKKAKP